jgi:putative phosphoesterase
VKIGIISDIHSNAYALNSVMQELTGMDLIFCAGDITGYYPFVNEVFYIIDRNPVIIIQGNHDAYLCGDKIKNLSRIDNISLDYTKTIITPYNLVSLKMASKRMEISVDGLKFLIVHGSPWDELEEYVYPDYPFFEKFYSVAADVVILGHTHYPMIKEIGDKLIINPGSCGQPRDYDPRASFAIFDTSTRKATINRVHFK